MLKRAAWLGLLALGWAPGLGAEPVDPVTARLAAEQWIRTCSVFIVEGSKLPAGGYAVTHISPIALPGLPLAAYHAALEPVGYIVVSGDRRMTPVICFSTTSDLHLDDVPENALRDLLMNDLAVSHAVLQGLDAQPRQTAAAETPEFVDLNLSRWSELLAPPEGRGTLGSDYVPTNILVAPLLNTAWTQWRHYNYKCPADTNEPPSYPYDGKAPAGCVPVAGAQTLKYDDWPTFGAGSHTYNDNAGNITGYQSAVFSDPYDWANMKTNYNYATSEPTSQVEAVAELIYELGVGASVDYNHDGTSANLPSLQSGLADYFYYEMGTHMSRAGDPPAFDQALRDDLLAGRPVICNLPTHGLVADGLSSDSGSNYFHFNYGWGGLDDGWYQPSNINTQSLDGAIFGAQPVFMPLLDPLPSGTNAAGIVTNTWTFPKRRTNEVAGFRLLEGVYVPTNIWDPGDRFSSWAQQGAAWTNKASGGNPGACYYKPNAKVSGEGSILSGPFVPGTDTLLRFDRKVQLYQDHFYAELSTNDGDSWIELLHDTGFPAGYTNGWWSTNFSLTAYAGVESRIRFRYGVGSYWNGDYGVYVDNVSYSNVQAISWSVVLSNLAATARTCKINGRLDGTYFYALQAGDGTNWGVSSPGTTVHVELADDTDTDEDGLPNGWEEQYFGSATGAVATADGDNDTMCNWDEWWAGCNPTSGLSVFTADGERGTNRNVLQWASISNRTYAVYRATNLMLGGFSAIATSLVATPTLNTYQDTNAPGSGPWYYRVKTEY